MSWIPLHVRSQYSILASSLAIEDLAARAAEWKLPALALTDQGNLYGAVEFYKACLSLGVKPIIGCELRLAPFSRTEKKKIVGHATGYPLVLLAKSDIGYRNLCKLCSMAHLEGFYYTPRIDKEILGLYAEGLVCLSGSLYGLIPSLILENKEEELQREILWFQETFKEDYYLEIQRHPMHAKQIEADGIDREPWLYQKLQDFLQKEEKIAKRLASLSRETGIPFVATNDSRYLDRDDWKAHEILMNIQSGEPCELWEFDSHGQPKNRKSNPKREVDASHEFYFKSPEEMSQLFADLPESVACSLEIADKCAVHLDFKTKYYPVFVPPALEGINYTKEERLRAAEEFLSQLCEENIAHRYGDEALRKVGEKYLGKDPLEVVRERLNYELELMISKGMCDYLLIVYDFIAWAKGQNIPVGPGRGSGVGSIVLYLIGITDIEPLRFNLFFERFINPERISYPDIDVDICMERRAEVIEYTLRKYGKQRVAQIITFGTMKAKMAIKDVGRTLSVPLAKVNAIAKLVPEDPGITLDKALEQDAEFKKLIATDEEAARIIEYARKLEGSVRNTGIHAAGIIISGDPLMERIPLCMSKDADMAVTQFSMKPLEAVGMLKIDFLGLKTLTSIQKAVDAIAIQHKVRVNWISLPLDDQPTFALLNQGRTLGIFQLESGGMQDLSRQIHIDRFEEIIAVGALYRPGPMEMIPSFINRKHGREPIENDHPQMADILAETYGVMVYQEQVMQIASRLAGYTLGEGDVLRRAMGKKDKEEMANQRAKFKLGAKQNGLDEETALRIFDKIEKFASYGFNKSHAAGYGYLSYVTAYLKANYPREWMAALMTCDRDDITRIAKIIRECRAMGIAILPPDINESGREFLATPCAIRFALTGIKGVGEGVVECIIGERARRGPFGSLYDFFKRIDTRKVGKKAVEQLIEAGCFDFTNSNRYQLVQMVEPLYERASKEQKEASKGIIHLFDHLDKDIEQELIAIAPPLKSVSSLDLLKKEKELLGFYLTGHPLDQYSELIHQLSCIELEKATLGDHDDVFRCAFVIEGVQVKLATRSQRKFAVLTVSDHGESYELTLWSDLYESRGQLLEEGKLIYAVLQVDKREGHVRFVCRWLEDFLSVNEENRKACDLAYDRIRMQTRITEEKRGSGKVNKNMKKEMPTKTLYIDVALEGARLSHILQIRQLFHEMAGNVAVVMRFYRQKDLYSELFIDTSWGVSIEASLQQGLEKIPSITSIKVEKG